MNTSVGHPVSVPVWVGDPSDPPGHEALCDPGTEVPSVLLRIPVLGDVGDGPGVSKEGKRGVEAGVLQHFMCK